MFTWSLFFCSGWRLGLMGPNSSPEDELLASPLPDSPEEDVSIFSASFAEPLMLPNQTRDEACDGGGVWSAADHAIMVSTIFAYAQMG